jgi:DNA-binding CsgD family transcriptional regulator
MPASIVPPRKSDWLSEMRAIMSPTVISNEETYRQIVRQIERCMQVEQNLRTNSMLMLVENAALRYLYMSESVKDVLGYTRDEIMPRGLMWLFSLLSAEEMEYKKQVSGDIMVFLKTLTRNQVLDCTVKYNITCRNKAGEVVHFLEEMMFPEVNEANEPVITSAFMHDISLYSNVNGTRQCNIFLGGLSKEHIVFTRTYHVGILAPPLSERELQVLRLFANGLTTLQAAEALSISENTVKSHRKNILAKLEVSNSAEAVHVCLKNNWIA